MDIKLLNIAINFNKNSSSSPFSQIIEKMGEVVLEIKYLHKNNVFVSTQFLLASGNIITIKQLNHLTNK